MPSRPQRPLLAVANPTKTDLTVIAAKSCAFAVLTCALCNPQLAQAKPANENNPPGVTGWISGSQTYLRARPGVNTPPVSKVEKYTKLFVWGKFNGWYRVETPEHKFGWVYNEYVNVPAADKLVELSHKKAKLASEKNEQQTMYGSVELLRKHYAKYQSPGAAKGLRLMGVSVPGPSPKIARPVPVAKPIEPKAAPLQPAVQHVQPRATVQETASESFLEKVTHPRVEATVESKPVEAVAPATQAAEVADASAAPVEAKPVEIKPAEAQPVAKIAPKPAAKATQRPAKVKPRSAARSKAPVATAAAPPSSDDSAITPDDLMRARAEFLAPRKAEDMAAGAADTETPAADGGAIEEEKTKAAAPAVSAPKKRAEAPKAAPAKKTAKIFRGGSPRDRARFAAAPTLGQSLASRGLALQGSPYIRGASSPNSGFDCSGLVYYLLRSRGYNPPRTSSDYGSYGTAVPAGHLQPGDIVLFANTYRAGISHVGIYVGDNKFVHAANPGKGVCVSSLNDSYYGSHYYGARRVK